MALPFPSLPAPRVFALILTALISSVSASPAATVFARGDLVRLTQGEMLMFQGKDLFSAPKEEEFTVLKHDPAKGVVYVEFYKEDGTLIAVTAPAAVFEPSPATGWTNLLKGVEAFRDQRYEDSKRLVARAAEDPAYRPLASALATRLTGALASGAAARSAPGARPGFTNALQALRDSAEQLVKLGHLCLALPLDEGADHLGVQVLGSAPGSLPPSKIDREDLATRVTTSNRALGCCRQAMALHKLFEATKYIDEGLKAEPERPELKAFQARAQKDIEEADGHHKNALAMRQIPKGTIHALTAVEMGLKLCVDHPKLRALKKDMQSAFEERTSPPVTPALLALAGAGASKQALEEGHHIYTTRCTECHDLELLDSRSMTAWRDIVGSMSRRAKITETEQARIVAYIAVAQRGMDAGSSQ